jgi:hypothetical protein
MNKILSLVGLVVVAGVAGDARAAANDILTTSQIRGENVHLGGAIRDLIGKQLQFRGHQPGRILNISVTAQGIDVATEEPNGRFMREYIVTIPELRTSYRTAGKTTWRLSPIGQRDLGFGIMAAAALVYYYRNNIKRWFTGAPAQSKPANNTTQVS